MDLRQLECFVTVADERSFTRAATRLHVVQPAVSATIASLEKELRTELLHRTSRRVDLTETGRVLLPKARATLQAAREALDAVDEVNGGIGGTLRIGTMSALAAIDLPRLLGEYHRAFPSVAVNLVTPASTEGSPGLIDALIDGRLDVAFVSIPGESPAGVELHDLVTTPLELIVPTSHPLAEHGELSIVNLADRGFVDSPIGCGNRAVTDRAFRTAGISREVIIEITAIADGADYVRNGLGIALLPAVVADPHDDLTSVPITDADLDLPVALAIPTNRTPAAAARAFQTLFTTAPLV